MNRLLFLDIEATGVDPYSDRIVEIAVADVRPEEEGLRTWSTLVDPGIPIPPGATEVHGITDDDVAEAPTILEIAKTIEALVAGAVLVGYNIRRYDVPLLDSELRRAGRDGLPRNEWGDIEVPEIDLYEVWRKAEPRNLVSAARRFAGEDFEDEAHRADADVAVLSGVLDGMAREFDLGNPEDPETLAELASLSVPDWVVDRSGKFRKEEDGTIVFDFGKHKGKPADSDRNYLGWMISADFNPDTKAWCRRILSGSV